MPIRIIAERKREIFSTQSPNEFSTTADVNDFLLQIQRLATEHTVRIFHKEVTFVNIDRRNNYCQRMLDSNVQCDAREVYGTVDEARIYYNQHNPPFVFQISSADCIIGSKSDAMMNAATAADKNRIIQESRLMLNWHVVLLIISNGMIFIYDPNFERMAKHLPTLSEVMPTFRQRVRETIYALKLNELINQEWSLLIGGGGNENRRCREMCGEFIKSYSVALMENSSFKPSEMNVNYKIIKL